jgi:hypothetical protein
MTTEEKIWIATVAFHKKIDSGTLYYSDYMYGHERETEDVWEYVEELQEIGREAFYQKYSQYRLY